MHTTGAQARSPFCALRRSSDGVCLLAPAMPASFARRGHGDLRGVHTMPRRSSFRLHGVSFPVPLLPRCGSAIVKVLRGNKYCPSLLLLLSAMKPGAHL